MMLSPRLLNLRADHIVNATILSINGLLIGSSICAQVVPDGTVNTQVNFVDGQIKITGGRELGTNLFHSFREFSPTTNFVTHFENNSNIENIFTRVTGGSASLIDGKIVTNGSASLFILNPAGIIFGNNAHLDIGGSFIATTAESIIFEDGTIFGTQIKNTSPLLTVSIPIGLQYGDSPGAISSNNTDTINLDVSPENNLFPGNTIALLGGNIELQNISINSLSGNVEITSVAEGEEVGLVPSLNGWEFNYESVKNFNNITITQASEINSSGQQGKINLQGKDIFLNPGLRILNFTDSDFDESSISSISLLATNYIDLNGTVISTQVDPSGPNQLPVTVKGGKIEMLAKDIKIRNGSIISANTFNQGQGGDITIDARESFELSGFNNRVPSQIVSSVGSSGAGGTIDINTHKLVITDGARLDSSSFGTGKAGNINVKANESILISGSSLSKTFNTLSNSGLFASSGKAKNKAASGSITVNTSQLSIEEGGEISVSNFGSGDAGDINIKVGELLLNNDSQIAATGNRGNIAIEANNNIVLFDTGKISVSNSGSGDAGDINITNLGDLLLYDNSQIISTRATGDEGSININSSEIILRDLASIATTASGDGNGGNITIDANNLVLLDDSKINANANLGNGGNITITTQSLLTPQGNTEDAITASSDFGVNGIVEINLPDDNSKLETTEARIAALAGEESLYKGCSLGTDFSANRFSYIGRGGIRLGPFDPLESYDAIADLGFGDESEFQNINIQTNNNLYNYDKIKRSSTSITEATVWVINERGKVELVAQAPNYSVPSECLFK